MKIRTDTILRLRDHLVATSTPGASDRAADSTADAILRRIDPFAELMYAVIAADTVVRPEEKQALISALDILGGGVVPVERLATLVSRFEPEDPAVDSEARVAAAAARIGGGARGPRDGVSAGRRGGAGGRSLRDTGAAGDAVGA